MASLPPGWTATLRHAPARTYPVYVCAGYNQAYSIAQAWRSHARGNAEHVLRALQRLHRVLRAQHKKRKLAGALEFHVGFGGRPGTDDAVTGRVQFGGRRERLWSARVVYGALDLEGVRAALADIPTLHEQVLEHVAHADALLMDDCDEEGIVVDLPAA